jgi:hypothetical protein
MIINIFIKNISNDIEKKLIKLINFKPYQCYNEISENELQNFNNMQKINNYDNIDKNLFISLRNSCIRYKMITKHHTLIKNTKKMIEDYNNKMDVLNISKKYDGSPLNILRIIYAKIYPKISFKTLINDGYNKLSEEDKKQFIKANKNDKFAIINQQKMHDDSLLFEKEVEKILIKNNIKYKTQEILCKEQVIEHGKCISTPDFLILSKFIVNNVDIKWIDAKNFYGANNKFILDSIKKQTKKYVELYGNGIIVFKLGCNEKLVFDNIICIAFNQISNL